MIFGYFVLGGLESDIPEYLTTYCDHHLGDRPRGRWHLSTDHQQITINIPSRDKQVMLWSNYPEEFSTRMSTLDSQFSGLPYLGKLQRSVSSLPLDFEGFVNNRNKDSHSSFAVLVPQGIDTVGLHDPKTGASFLLFSSVALGPPPERYLLYRFPQTKVLFISSEATCSKWWRWTSKSSVLLAFNALEKRLGRLA